MKRTGNSKIAVVGWGRGMGHTGHMYLADAVITQAKDMKADPYFFVSKTVGKDDPLLPEEKLSIYQTVFPQQKNIFTAEGNLNQALQELAKLGYQGVVLVVGADQKESFKYLEKPNKEGVPVYQSFGFSKLKVISRQETRSQFRGEEGPRATPMRQVLLDPNASDEQKYEVWRRDMPSALSDEQVMNFMNKAASRLTAPKATKAANLDENRIMDRDARINAYYVSKRGDRHRVAENIPYYLLDKLVPLLTKKYAITMNDIEVRPADKNQYRRTHQPELAEGVQCTPNEVAELLYNAKPEIFTKFGDEFVMDTITQACEQHQGSAQEVAGKVVEILKQGITEGIFDRFKKKPAQPEVADPGNYPRIGSDIAQWMADTVEYHKAKFPDSVWKLFCPTYPDYLPVRVRVGTSEKIMHQHLEDYINLRNQNPEAVRIARQKFDKNNTYPSGPRDDYTNKVTQQGVAEEAPGMKDGRPYSDPLRRHPGNESYMTPEYLIQKYKERLAQIASGPYKRPKEVAQLQSRIAKLEKQGLEEASFDKEEFRRHMEQLRAREELRKTDPVSAKALDLRDALPQATKKKPEDDSIGINDPRHPGYAYTQAGQHKVDEDSEDDGIYLGAKVYHKEHQSGEPFKVVKIIDDQRVGVIDDYGNKEVLFINQLVPAEGVAEGEEEALAYATKAHAGQTRSGGDPYITHPMRVADHIRKYKQSHNLDALISAAYLHDTIEDTSTTQEALHDLFGGLVASLVQELTSDPEEIKRVGKKQYLAHKMAAMSSYALVIKLADRLDNVKDITTAKTPEWRHKYAQETAHILDYIEKTRALSGTHRKLIELIRAKLAEIDNPPQQEVEEAAGSLGLRTWSGQVKLAHGKDVKFYNRKNDTIDRVVAMKGQKLVGIFDRATDKGRVIDEGITRRGILKGIAGAGALGAAGKASAIAGAFPTPSAQQAMYKAAADSNRAEAKRQAELKAKADSERLEKNTQEVDKEQRINHHRLNDDVTETNDYLDEK